MISLLDINVKSLHADLNPSERSELITDFQTNENGIQIILLNFMIGVSGLNMQRWCRNIIFFEGPPNVQIERQAIGRVRRIGQKRWVRVIRLLVEESFSLRTNAMLKKPIAVKTHS
jgi:DNA repair protein RAD16